VSTGLSEIREALDELRKKFPDPDYFLSNFAWKCDCGKNGFPGCDKPEHFADRVYLALIDYHQMKGTLDQCGGIRQRRGLDRVYDLVLRVMRFTPKRFNQLMADSEKAIQILQSCFGSKPMG
jgi:hypothetical protein